MNYQTKAFIICKDLSANKFLKVWKFFDDVTCRKCIYLKTANVAYAADLLHVHKACMSWYILKF